ncbi:MAG: hypothetical protein KJO54_01525 [Gammaproteobacteria bacterium]|nr:hypothetical protein [Gammaproteobacteria bacterium]
MNAVATISAAVLFSGLTLSGPVSTEPVNSIAAGVFHYGFDSSSNDLSGPQTPGGIRVSARDTSTLAIVYTRHFSDQWSLVLALGAPPTYKLKGEGIVTALGDLGKARAISPAVLLQRHFDLTGSLVPFVGIGASYNQYSSAHAFPALEAALGGETAVHIDGGFAPVLITGFDVVLSARLLTTLSVSFNDLDADITLNTSGIERNIAVDLDPVVYRLTLGFRF